MNGLKLLEWREENRFTELKNTHTINNFLNYTSLKRDLVRSLGLTNNTFLNLLRTPAYPPGIDWKL